MASSLAAKQPSRYIVGPVYDWLLFLLPPVIALALGLLISGTAFADNEFDFYGYDVSWSSLLIGVFIHAHLVIVFFRSHGNPRIRALYPFRFLAVPVLLYAAMMSSMWVLISVSVLTTFWDVYHSGLQTFGFARIYDRKCGNDPNAGRTLDWCLNNLLYAGPILAGATMIDHFEDLEKFEDLGTTFFSAVPAFMESHQRYYARALLAFGTLFLLYYVFAQWRLHRRGHEISRLKVYLLASTGLCSIYSWGFNSWGEAFFIMNFFHALQYFGLVWATEKRNLMRLFRVEGLRLGKPIALALFLGLACAYGVWVEALDAGIEWLWSVTLVVSIMHFWYDGFIWSVRKRQV